MEEIHEVKEDRELECVFSLPVAIVFKNSPVCGISRYARQELETFMEGTKKNVPVFLIDVIENRNVSIQFAERSGIPHESPQVIYLEKGMVKWHASHYEITADALERVIP
jgi:bacillithiol system protein YtxJ